MVNQDLRDRLIRALYKKTRACASDLRGEGLSSLSVDQVMEVIEDLEKSGLVSQAGSYAEDPNDKNAKYQQVYELVG